MSVLCDFCNQNNYDAPAGSHFVVGLRRVAICSDCVSTCVEIITERQKQAAVSDIEVEAGNE
jgi:ATP-dependent protease Clp ATPase subunit